MPSIEDDAHAQVAAERQHVERTRRGLTWSIGAGVVIAASFFVFGFLVGRSSVVSAPTATPAPTPVAPVSAAMVPEAAIAASANVAVPASEPAGADTSSGSAVDFELAPNVEPTKKRREPERKRKAPRGAVATPALGEAR